MHAATRNDRSAVPLLWGYGQYWKSLGPRERTAIILRTVIDYAVMVARRRHMRRIELRELTKPKALTRSDLPLLFVVRNELDRLAPFLRHYRNLGITRFFAVDDQSSDGTLEQLLAEPDVSTFVSNVRYGDARKGELWRQALAERMGLNRWYVNADVDEFLVYDGMDVRPLPELIAWLEARGLKRSLAPMVDLYPLQELSSVHYDASREPWKTAGYFDSSGYTAGFSKKSIEITGGPLKRFFLKVGNRTKFPVIYWDRQTSLARTIHAPLPYWRNFDPPLLALLHFKLFSDFEQKCIEAIEDGQRHLNARSYRQYYERLQEEAQILLEYDDSIRFSGPQALIAHGFMAPLDWNLADRTDPSPMDGLNKL
jgi:hypothetical protein